MTPWARRKQRKQAEEARLRRLVILLGQVNQHIYQLKSTTTTESDQT